MGIYYRYTAPENNSQLLLGSRAGIAVSPEDATKIRFTVGPAGASGGHCTGRQDRRRLRPAACRETMPVTEEALAEHADDPAYIVMGNLLFGTDAAEVPLTVRDPEGEIARVDG